MTEQRERVRASTGPPRRPLVRIGTPEPTVPANLVSRPREGAAPEFSETVRMARGETDSEILIKWLKLRGYCWMSRASFVPTISRMFQHLQEGILLSVLHHVKKADDVKASAPTEEARDVAWNELRVVLSRNSLGLTEYAFVVVEDDDEDDEHS